MSQMQLHNDTHLTRTNSEITKKPIPRWVKLTVVISVWSLLVAGSFGLAYSYMTSIRQQLAEIQQTNQTNVQDLNTKLEALQLNIGTQKDGAVALSEQFRAVEGDLKLVKEELSLAGSSLNTTASTKQALSERITALSKELEELRKLIKKLEEAARAY
ncbi:hypothetical protein D3C73_569400 [compost metagenome]